MGSVDTFLLVLNMRLIALDCMVHGVVLGWDLQGSVGAIQTVALDMTPPPKKLRTQNDIGHGIMAIGIIAIDHLTNLYVNK